METDLTHPSPRPIRTFLWQLPEHRRQADSKADHLGTRGPLFTCYSILHPDLKALSSIFIGYVHLSFISQIMHTEYHQYQKKSSPYTITSKSLELVQSTLTFRSPAKPEWQGSHSIPLRSNWSKSKNKHMDFSYACSSPFSLVSGTYGHLGLVWTDIWVSQKPNSETLWRHSACR